jgi:hypothetical protein
MSIQPANPGGVNTSSFVGTTTRQFLQKEDLRRDVRQPDHATVAVTCHLRVHVSQVDTACRTEWETTAHEVVEHLFFRIPDVHVDEAESHGRHLARVTPLRNVIMAAGFAAARCPDAERGDIMDCIV